jgi:hypothetical protein
MENFRISVTSLSAFNDVCLTGDSMGREFIEQGGSDGNNSDMYLGGYWFESWQPHTASGSS